MNDPHDAQTAWAVCERPVDDAQPWLSKHRVSRPNSRWEHGPTHFRIIVSIVFSNRGASNECGDEKSSSGLVVDRFASNSGGYRSWTRNHSPTASRGSSLLRVGDSIRASTLHDRICCRFAMERATRRGMRRWRWRRARSGRRW